MNAFYCLFCCCWSSWKELGPVLSDTANQIALRGLRHYAPQIRAALLFMMLLLVFFQSLMALKCTLISVVKQSHGNFMLDIDYPKEQRH